jgi:hypothetical protein
MNEWLPVVLQGVSVVATVGGVVVAVASRISRIEGRIDTLATEIRKDRELVEHRIRQLEIGMSQVRAELSRLSYSVGGLNRQEHKTPEDMS